MWSAPPADEPLEDKMKVERMVLGQIQTNCYFAINEATKETIVIDPADRPDSVLRKAVDEGLDAESHFPDPRTCGSYAGRTGAEGKA